MKGILSLFFVCFCVCAFAQGTIDFGTRLHDFGTIKEINGPVSYDFEFVNNGTAPILIRNVESSCGCTSPEWTKQPVLPGKKGFVRAIFDPKDRPGYFDKTITVFSNARTPAVEMKIKGSVEGKARTVLDDYPYEQPSGLRLPLEYISLMKVQKGETKTMNIGVFNNSGRNVNVTFVSLPSHLQMSMEPRQIPDKGKAVIRASYNTALKGEFGDNREEVTMMVDGKKYTLPVSVFIEEDLSKVAPASAPAVSADKRIYNFGAAASAQNVFRLTNTGKSVMKIHRVYANDKRVTVLADKKELQPGESAAVTVATVKGAEPGKMTCVVSVITNCPDSPEFSLRFYGEIK